MSAIVTEEDAHQNEAETKRGSRAGYVLFVLTTACLLSYVDRYTLNVLLGPIKGTMQLSDAQIGLLVGFAFAMFYSVMAAPFGWATDRFNRRNIIIGGVLVWSVATTACGLATNFGELLTARVLVGFGEATLMPAAYSMLADIYPSRQRGRAYGVFTMAVYVGGGIALLLGGGLLALSAGLVITIPQLAGFHPWQIVFLIIGPLGIPMAMLLLAAPEPKRRRVAEAGPIQEASLFRYVWRHRGPFIWVFGCYTLFSYVSFAVLPWAPLMMVRKFGLSPASAGLMIGLVTLVGGFVGALSAGAIGDHWAARGARGGRFRLTLPWWIGATVAIPCFAFAPTSESAAAGYMFFIFFNSIGYVSATAVIQDMVPSAMRGRIVAFWYVVTNVGSGLGPLVTGLLTDRYFGSESTLPLAIVVASIPALLLGLVCSVYGIPLYDALRVRIEGK